ncbi:hypothetical protein ACFFHJ_05090 [Planotetraspora thailandica]|uniref:RCC1 domain-containing protein n=1 Tax=Planotetraspora thailandica TaxID=487172 RepID=UPI0019513E89|nr:hypothetical protein [Planotetraspora thailandica]
MSAAGVAAPGPAAAASSGTSYTYAWGDGDYGQLGDESTADHSSPVALTALSQVAQVSAGFRHTLAVRADGTVWAWGSNDHGELGNGTTTKSSTPVQVTGLTDIVQVAASYYDSLALRSDGTVWAWGYNYYGELGDGTSTDRTTPVQVAGLTGVTQIDVGNYHNLALRSDGTVAAWGYNNYGQLGGGTKYSRSAPVTVPGLSDVTQIAGGYYHSLALRSDGTVVAWGYNAHGALGDGTTTNRTTPVVVSGLTNVTQIAGGSAHNLALHSDGTVAAWGNNNYGQLGDSTTTAQTTPVTVPGLSDVAVISAGYWHNVALRSDGTVVAWGYNGDGELGDGTSTTRTTPVIVPGLSSVTEISAGAYHTLAKVGPPGLTARVAITGEVGTTLNCKPAFVGATSVSYTWLWDGVAVPGATTATYTPASWDAGHQATCQVTATNGLGTTDTSATVTIAPAKLAAGSALIADIGKSYSYHFAVTGWPTPKIALVSGALPPGLKLATDGTLSGTPSQGGTYQFTLSATNGVGTAATVERRVVVQVRPELIAKATITGNGNVGTTLTCEASFLDANSVRYTWLRDGNPIPGATTYTYTPVAGDVGHTVTCQVVGTNSVGSTETSASISVTLGTSIGGFSASLSTSGKLSVKGTVTGPPSAVPVQIEYSTNGSTGWTTVQTLNTVGAFTSTFTPPSVPAYYRAETLASAAYTGAVSGSVKVDKVVTSISGFTASVNASHILTVHGTVGPSGLKVPVLIEYSADGKTGWKTAKTITVGGAFTTTLKAPLTSGYYRAHVLNATYYKGTVSHAVKAARTLTRIAGLKVSATRVKKNSYFTVTGTLQKYSGGWKALTGQRVQIVFHVKGGTALHLYSTPLTGTGGKFTARIKATREAYWKPMYPGATGYYAYTPSPYIHVTLR